MENEGIALTRDQFLDTFGLRDDTIIAKWLGVAATPEAIQRIADAKEELYVILCVTMEFHPNRELQPG